MILIYAFEDETHRPTVTSKLLQNFTDPALGNEHNAPASRDSLQDGHEIPTQKKRRGMYLPRN